MNYAIGMFLFVTCIFIGNIQSVYCQAASDAGTTQIKDLTPELRGLLPAQPNEVAETAPAVITNDLTNRVTVSVEQDYVPLDHMRGLVVKVDNQSAHPVLVNCDAAKATLLPSNTASLIDLEKVERPPTGFKEVLLADTRDTLVAGLTVGAIPAIDGIRIQHGPILKRYGADERRRQNEVQRFGKRIMWPGEISTGTIFFKTDASLKGSRLEIPLSLPFRNNGAAQISQTISTQVPK